MGGPARLVSRPRAYGRERVPRTGGLVYAVNHMHWLDIPLVGALSPRNIDFVAKVEAVRVPGIGRFLEWHGTIAVRRGESDRVAVRKMLESARERARRRALRRGHAPQDRPARHRAAGCRDGRDPGRRAGDPDGDLRHAVLEARQLRAVLARVRRAASLRRPAEERPWLQGRRPRRSSGASTSSSTGSPTCTSRAARKAWCHRYDTSEHDDDRTGRAEVEPVNLDQARSRSSASRTSASRR